MERTIEELKVQKRHSEDEAGEPNDETIAAIHDAREGKILTQMKVEQLDQLVEG